MPVPEVDIIRIAKDTGTTQEITGTTQEITAAVYGDLFAVHETGCVWSEHEDGTPYDFRSTFTVTHIPTGRAMQKELSNKQAHAWAYDLSENAVLCAVFAGEDMAAINQRMRETEGAADAYHEIGFYAALEYGDLFGESDGAA